MAEAKLTETGTIIVMQTRHLEAFKLVMELGSFTKAAEVLCVSQPAVSKMIAMLEKECRFKLFEKKHNRTVPTPEAAMLFTEVDRMIFGTRAVEERASAIRNKRYGRIDIYAFPSITTNILPRIISEFIDDHQGVRVSVSVRDASTFNNLSLSQNFDLGISAVEINRIGISCRSFIDMEVVCALPKNHPLAKYDCLTPELIGNTPMIDLRAGQLFNEQIQLAFSRERVERNIVAESTLSEAACAFVQSGTGIALVDPLPLFNISPNVISVRQFKPVLACKTYFLEQSSRRTPLVVESLKMYLASRMPDILSGIISKHNIPSKLSPSNAS